MSAAAVAALAEEEGLGEAAADLVARVRAGWRLRAGGRAAGPGERRRIGGSPVSPAAGEPVAARRPRDPAGVRRADRHAGAAAGRGRVLARSGAAVAPAAASSCGCSPTRSTTSRSATRGRSCATPRRRSPARPRRRCPTPGRHRVASGTTFSPQDRAALYVHAGDGGAARSQLPATAPETHPTLRPDFHGSGGDADPLRAVGLSAAWSNGAPNADPVEPWSVHQPARRGHLESGRDARGHRPDDVRGRCVARRRRRSPGRSSSGCTPTTLCASSCSTAARCTSSRRVGRPGRGPARPPRLRHLVLLIEEPELVQTASVRLKGS